MSRTKGNKNKNTKGKAPFVPMKTPPKFVKPLSDPTEKLEDVKKVLKIDGVAPRKEVPNIPSVLIDGGMLYRFLLELRREYDNLIVAGKDDTKESRKRAIQVIDVIMDYIMRMEKKT